jgi:hypothetical protein
LGVSGFFLFWFFLFFHPEGRLTCISINDGKGKVVFKTFRCRSVLVFWVFGRPLGGLDTGGKIASFDTPEEILLRFTSVTEAGRPFRNAASSYPGDDGVSLGVHKNSGPRHSDYPSETDKCQSGNHGIR